MELMDDYPLVLTPKDVRKILNWSCDQTYRLFASKKFPSEKIQGKYIIPKQRFLNWLGYQEGGEINEMGAR